MSRSVALLTNVLLALVWTAMTGRFTLPNLLLGLSVGFLVLYTVEHVRGRADYFDKVRQVILFAAFFLRELSVAAIRVGLEVVRPRPRITPAILAVPLDARTDTEITWLANLVTLTPGSVSLDLSDDRTVLYVHFMFGADRDAAVREVKERIERRLLKVLR